MARDMSDYTPSGYLFNDPLEDTEIKVDNGASRGGTGLLVQRSVRGY